MRRPGNPIVRLLLAVAMPVFVAGAQERATEHHVNGWYQYFGDHPIGGSKWGVHLEGQYRRHNVITQWQQLLLRPGVNYRLNPHVLLTAGYCFVRAHRYSDRAAHGPALNEHRLWEQVRFDYGTKPVSWITRIRFENRFVGVSNAATGRGDFRYENRLRLYQQATRRLSKSTYVTAYDEFWVYIRPYVSASAFDQNRAYAAFGVNLKPGWRFEMGYMNQALLQRSGRVLESNHTVVAAIYSTAPLFRFR